MGIALKLNINKHTLDFVSRYWRESKSLEGHSLAQVTRFGLNVLTRPIRSFYYPEFLKAEITTSCNMSCTFCGAAKADGKTVGRVGKHMSPEILQKLLSNIPMIRWIDIQGVGEPLTHPNFLEILRLLSCLGVSVQFTTNGTLLNAGVLDSISGGIVHSITISLSASCATSYLRLHGSNFFDLVLENVRRVVRSRRGGKPKVRVLAVIMSQNLSELNRLIEITKDLGVDSLVLSAYKPISGEDWNEPSRIELRRAVADAKAYAGDVGITLELEVPAASEEAQPGGRGLSSGRCLWPWVSLAVDADGDVMPCCYSMGNRRYELGNLSNESIRDIFNNRAYRSFRSALNIGKTEALICHNCNDHAW